MDLLKRPAAADDAHPAGLEAAAWVQAHAAPEASTVYQNMLVARVQAAPGLVQGDHIKYQKTTGLQVFPETAQGF
jgi:hypothetical protein